MAATATGAELEKKIRDLELEIAKLREERHSLRERLEDLAEIFSLSPDMLSITDINTAMFLKVNPAFTAILGYSEKQLLERSFLDFVHPDDLAATVDAINYNLKAGEQLINFTNRVRCRDGTYKWLNWVSSPLPARGISIGVAHDITERKNVEDALQASETLVRSIMDNLPIGIAVNSVDPTVTFEYMNDNFARFYRTSREALSGTDTFWDAVYEDPGFREKIKQRILADCATGDPARMYWQDVPITRKGQETTYIVARNTPIPDKGLMISTVWDVTDRKRTEAALRETKRLLEETQAITKLGGWEYDVLSQRLTWTDEVYRIHGLKPGEISITPQIAIGFYPPASASIIEAAFGKAVERGEPYDLELKIIRADGASTWIRTMGRPVVEDGRTVRVTGNILDITERKQAEEAHEKLQIQLLQAQKLESIGTLAGGIAHDFNNILSGLIGYTQLALSEVDAMPGTREKLMQVLKAGERAADLVKQILSFSRSHEIEYKPVDIGFVTREVLKLIRATIPSNIEIRQSLNSQGLVCADATNIHQVVMNLCTNAAYAMRETGGVLSVGLDNISLSKEDLCHHPGVEPGNFIKLSVTDSGTGMAEDVQQKAFDPFFTTKDPGEGTGMGLASVHGIATNLGGFVSLSSTPGRGTAIHVLLPLIEAAGGIEPGLKEETIEGGGERILFIDDEPTQRELTKEALSKYGYQVVTFGDSTVAWIHFQQDPEAYDLVITDMTMPKMTGDVLTRKIRSKRDGIPVIMCTGYSEMIDEDKARALDIDAFLYKPVTIAELLKSIRKVLEQKNRMC